MQQPIISPPPPQQKPIRVQIEGLGIVEFPTGTSEADMQAALDKQHATTRTATKPNEPAEPEFWQVLRQSMRQHGAQQFGSPVYGDFAAGAAKGAARTMVGLGELASKAGLSKVTDALYGMPSGSSAASFGPARQDVSARTPGEKVGQFSEQLAEFGLPGAGVTKIKAALTTGRGVLDAIIGATIEGVSAGAVGSAQEGRITVAPAIAAAAGSIAAPGVSKGLTWLGERIEKSLVKATARDVQNGFQVSNIYKHQLGGTLSETFDKSTAKLTDLGQQLKTELSKSATNPAFPMVPQVDVLGALADAAKDLANNAGKTMGRNQAIERAVQNYLDDPAFQSLVKSGKTDLLTANQIKQGVGDLGAWASGARDLDANAAEIVANEFYSKLRTAIEKAAPAGPGRIQNLNRQMAEIIPIRQAIIRRIPVEQRSNVINLGDMIGLASNDIGIALANRLLRSGRMANVAAQTGNLLEGLQPSATGARIAAGLTSQVNRR